MKRTLTFSLAVLLCLAIAHAQPYPSWFYQTPEAPPGVSLAVGYAGKYEHLESSYEEALRDAAGRMFVDWEARVVGESGFLSGPAGKAALGNTFRIEADTAGFGLFCSTLVRLDSVVVGKLALLLVGTRKITVPEAASRLSGKPAWVNKLPEDGEHLYAVGVAQAFEHPQSSWREAERRARIELALSAQCKVKGLDKQSNAYGEGLSTLETDVFLRRVQTVARWKDRNTGACWVMVRGE